MKAGGGKAKGSAWERTICRELSLWISNGERDDVFWRSAMSGGRATIGLQDGIERRAQVGDISAIASAGETLLNTFVIEAKFYADLQLLQSIAKDSGYLWQFWNHLRQYSAHIRKYPLLIARQNRMPAFVLMYPESALLFGLNIDYVSAFLPRLRCSLILFDCFLREAKIPRDAVYVKQDRRARL